jgi:hypothetical protein
LPETGRLDTGTATPRAAIARGTPPHPDLRPLLESLAEEVERLSSGVADLQMSVLELASRSTRSQDRPESMEPVRPIPPPLTPDNLGMAWGAPTLPPGGRGAMMSGISVDGVSDRTREYVEHVLRDHAELARQRIETGSFDPEHPDPYLILREMQDCREDMMHELRSNLPRREFDALFPRKTGMTDLR